MTVSDYFFRSFSHLSSFDKSENESKVLCYFQLKQMETSKISWEYQLKAEKDKLTKKDKELDKLKTERAKWETKSQAIEAELNVSFESKFF